MPKPWRVSDLRLFGEVLTLVPGGYSEILPDILEYKQGASRK
jgi:hypothetical protein